MRARRRSGGRRRRVRSSGRRCTPGCSDRLAEDIEAGGADGRRCSRATRTPRAVGARAAAARAACTGWCSSAGRVRWRPSTPASAAPGSLEAGDRGVPAPCSSASPTPSASGSTGRRRPTRSAASAALMGGLLHLDEAERLPVRLFEIGSSGGLNLLADRFAYVDGGRDGRTATRVRRRLDPAWRGTTPDAVAGPAHRRADRAATPMPVDVVHDRGPARADGVRLARPARPASSACAGRWPSRSDAVPDVRRAGAADFAAGIGSRTGPRPCSGTA